MAENKPLAELTQCVKLDKSMTPTDVMTDGQKMIKKKVIDKAPTLAKILANRKARLTSCKDGRLSSWLAPVRSKSLQTNKERQRMVTKTNDSS